MGRPSEARKHILIAAIDLLWEKSYHALTVDAVCARAEVRKGSLYHCFPSKSALVVEALQFFWATTVQPAYQKHFHRHNPPLERISNFLEWLRSLQMEKYRAAGKILGWPFFTLGCELSTNEPAINQTLRHIDALELWYFEGAIGDLVDRKMNDSDIPRIKAVSLRSSIQGVLARARVLNDPKELKLLATLPQMILSSN
ncbi:MAG: TetR/AcrR family transcriptional regulator [Verrucomicrobiota bacterium]|nr:TetR/AcrR family transcriptional regulator [Verrucomicrobiota bacterium]